MAQQNRLDRAMHLGGALGGAVTRPASAVVAGALGLERGIRQALGRRIEDTTLAALDAALASRIAEEAVDRAIASRLAGHAINRVFDEGKLVDDAVVRLLESEDLWLLVDEIARSPAVTEAIARQGVSFADQVAGGMRERSQRADARLERAARRALRRRPSGAPRAGS
jgi:hypothetical protein